MGAEENIAAYKRHIEQHLIALQPDIIEAIRNEMPQDDLNWVIREEYLKAAKVPADRLLSHYLEHPAAFALRNRCGPMALKTFFIEQIQTPPEQRSTVLFAAGIQSLKKEAQTISSDKHAPPHIKKAAEVVLAALEASNLAPGKRTKGKSG